MAKSEYTVAQLAAIYNVYKDMDDTRVVHCCTCGKPIYIAEVSDALPLYGHFYARSQEPLLKYHPDNTQVQCMLCNMTPSKEVEDAYVRFMRFKYGEGIFDQLISERGKYGDNVETKNYYLGKLRLLVHRFPELRRVVGLPPLAVEEKEANEGVEPEDGMLKSVVEQFKTFCITYRQDLDTLTKAMGTEHIEYERL